jgi:hypothetical protein
MSSYEIGSANCEDSHKINIKNIGNQFLPDPLFSRRLQAFDSNSLKSLFMNIFGVSLGLARPSTTSRAPSTANKTGNRLR